MIFDGFKAAPSFCRSIKTCRGVANTRKNKTKFEIIEISQMSEDQHCEIFNTFISILTLISHYTHILSGDSM